MNIYIKHLIAIIFYAGYHRIACVLGSTNSDIVVVDFMVEYDLTNAVVSPGVD